MSFQKYKPGPPPKDKIVKEMRLVNGKLRSVETFNGKIVRVFDDGGNIIDDRSAKFGNKLPPLPEIRPKPKIENIPNTEEDNPKEEIPKILDDSTTLPPSSSTTEIGKIELISKEETVRQSYSPKHTKVDVTTPIPTEDIKTETKPAAITTPEQTEDIKAETKPVAIITPEQTKDIKAETKPTVVTTPKPTEDIKLDTIPEKEETIIDTPKTDIPETPIVETHKIAQNIQDIKVIDRLDKIIEKKTKQEPPKAEIPKEISKEAPKFEQNKIKKPKEVKHRMTDEEETIMEERKFEEWLKKHKFNESVQKMAEIAEENQKEIGGISSEITGVKNELGDVENRIDNLKDSLGSVLGTTKKPITETLGELCTGVDCIKEDVKKHQGIQLELEKKMDQRFSELRERVQKLEEPIFMCDNCGHNGIRSLSSFCPNCGSPIHEWYDDSGQPVKGWVPFWKRVSAKQTAPR